MNSNVLLLSPRKLSSVFLSGVLLFLSAPAFAQQPQVPLSQGSDKLQQHPLVELEKTQPTEGDEYQLGPGDEVSVTVVGRPELTGTHIVGPDGKITIAMSGAVQVGDLSRDEAAKAISDSLKGLYTSTVVNVQVTKYGANRVLLIGDIQHPGVLYFDGTPTLLEAITRGGSLIGSDKSTRMPANCIIYRGNTEIGTVDLKEVFRTGDVKLHRNDIIYVPGDQQRLLSVLGEVKVPGPVALKENTTLVSLLADAGGITPQAGTPIIQVINPKTGNIQRVNYKDLLTAKGRDVTLDVGDIVYIPKSGIAKVGFFFQQIGPAISIATIGAFAAR